MQLNDAQRQAVLHDRGPCLVLAGPGSGKTMTIAARIAYLIQKRKVRPEEILVITFTRHAAREMQERFRRVSKGQAFPVTFGTFHGVYYEILKWAYALSSENILSEGEKYRIFREILESPGIMEEMEVLDEKEETRDLAAEISKAKNGGLNPEEFRSERYGKLFIELYRRYEKQKKAMRKLDFDDMLLGCLRLFRSRKDILAKWQERFRYLLVDEFQDINRVQYEVLKLLALPENNLFVVGDDDQSIYGFRGSRPQIMLGFRNDYPSARQILLNVNYRCAAPITEGALRVIRHNGDRFPKEIMSLRPKGTGIYVQKLKDPEEESRYVISHIQRLAREGQSLNQIAVLFRTGADAGILSETMLERRISFRMRERIPNLYDHFIARNLQSYLQLAAGKRDRCYFLDIMNCPARYLSRESVESPVVSFEELRRFYCDRSRMLDRIDQFESDIQMLEGRTPYAAIQYIRRKIGYDEYLKAYAADRRINEEELFEILEEIGERAKGFRTSKEWFAHIGQCRAKEEEQKHQENGEKDAVTLMTMHSAKGLEYDSVFLIGCNEGTIPHKKAKLDAEIEEERRIFYVAMTRAKSGLYLSYVQKKNGKDMLPSRFIEELLLKV